MNSIDKQDKIQEAMNLIEEALTLVDEVVEDMPIRANYEAYGRYGFNTLLGSGNPYDSSLHSIMDELEEMDDDKCEEFKLVAGDLELHFSKQGSKWVEEAVQVLPGSDESPSEFRNFGSKTYGSYLSPEEILGWIEKDYDEYAWEIQYWDR